MHAFINERTQPLLFMSEEDILKKAIRIGNELNIRTNATSVPKALMYLSVIYYVCNYHGSVYLNTFVQKAYKHMYIKYSIVF